MKKTAQNSFLAFLLLALVAGASAAPVQAAGASAAPGAAEKIYYGIEINGVLCGYSEIETSPLMQGGKELILLEQRMLLMVSALGSKFDSKLKLTYHIDPAAGRFTYHDSFIDQGTTQLDSQIHVEGDVARVSTSLSAEDTVVELGPDVILENTFFFPHLVRDFVRGDATEKSYEIFEVRESAVQTSTYTRAGRESVEIAGQSYDAVLLDKLNQVTGLKVRMWLDTESGRVVQVEAPNNRRSYLANASVMKRIEVANLDSSLVTKVGVAIPDVHGISRMKVRAKIEPTGLWITPQSLNVPGQKFTGTVENNLVEGIFEIEHPRYDGADAPPFPPAFGDDEALSEFLAGAEFIEADDPVLIAMAEKLTAGSADSWEAVQRLSRWVAENIDYAIPGGMTARNTYDTRTGECGAHSFLLAAFARAVGIPARVVWGCTYVPTGGGGFGQHGWNEVYMGEAGWIPLDTTAFEIDFVDSGHIRLGEVQSMVTALNPIEMELLEYRVGDGTAQAVGASTDDRFSELLGEYTNAESGRTLTVKLQNGSVTIDIPDQVVLALNEPDEQERWYCTMSNRLYCTFGRDETDRVVEMAIHEIVRMRRTAAPETIDENVPEKFRPYLGTYLLAPLQADFVVIYRDGSLAVEDPLAKLTVGLQAPDERGGWRDEFDKNTIAFETDEDGAVTALVVDSVSRFRR